MILVINYFSLYFANSGLQTQLNLLTSGQVWWTLVVLLLLASAAKIIPVTLVSKVFTKKPWRYCLSIGVLMNTRGIVQLVVLNIGVGYGVLSPIIFSLFVLMATILTFITSPILYLLQRKHFNEKKLSDGHIIEDMHERTGKEEQETNIDRTDSNQPIVSDGEMKTDVPRHSATIIETAHLPRRSSSKLLSRLSSNLPILDSFLAIDDRINYPEIDLDTVGPQPTVIGNIVTMPVCPPRRPLYMTRF